jgi:transposase
VTGATAEPLLLRQNDRDELVGLTRSSSVGAGLAARARIVLLAAEGTPNVEIARLVGVSRPTVNAWRTRYAERGTPGLADEQWSGRKRSIDQRRIVTETLRPPPAGLGVTHWSSRLLADRLGTSHVTVAAAWKRYGVKPWKAETSSSPPTRSWKPRSPTSSGYTWRRRRTRSCCAVTRKARGGVRSSV